MEDVSIHGLAFGPVLVIVGALSAYHYFANLIHPSRITNSAAVPALGLAPTIVVLTAYFLGVRERSDITFSGIVECVAATSLLTIVLVLSISAITGYDFPGSWRRPLKRSNWLLFKGLVVMALIFMGMLGSLWWLGDAGLQDPKCYPGQCSVGAIAFGSNLRAPGLLWLACLCVGVFLTGTIILSFNGLMRLIRKTEG